MSWDRNHQQNEGKIAMSQKSYIKYVIKHFGKKNIA